MTTMIALVTVFGLALVLASQKTRSDFRPRGRFAPSVTWGRLPALPRPAPATRPQRARATRPAPVRA
jgi:hypothetical protein